MAYSIAFITGIFIAGMVYINGILGSQTTPYLSNLIFHSIGLMVFTLFILFSPQNKIPPWRWALFIPGLMGTFTVVFNNWVVPHIGVSLTVALALLGQMITSITIDHFGLFNRKIKKINLYQSFGLIIVGLGLLVMVF